MSLEDELLKQRLDRIREIETLGYQPYGRRFDFTHTIPEILAAYGAKAAERTARARKRRPPLPYPFTSPGISAATPKRSRTQREPTRPKAANQSASTLPCVSAVTIPLPTNSRS